MVGQKVHIFKTLQVSNKHEANNSTTDLMHGSGHTNLSVWGNERDETNDAGICKKLCYFTNSSDVFFPVSGRKAQVLQQSNQVVLRGESYTSVRYWNGFKVKQTPPRLWHDIVKQINGVCLSTSKRQRSYIKFRKTHECYTLQCCIEVDTNVNDST